MSDYMSRSKKELPASTKNVHVEIDIHGDLWQELKTVCKESGWEITDGLPVILTIGLSALQRNKQPSENTIEDSKSDTGTADAAEQENES